MAGEKEYKRLSRARYWFRIAGLYQAKDHLLTVQNTGFSEEYKRFYFRDIQAILLRPSERLLLWSLVWGILSLGSGWLVYAANGFKYAPGSLFPWSIWFFPAFFLLCLAANLGLGPSCICHIKTAIQTVEVPLTRFRKAGKVIARLRPLIEQAQQGLPPTGADGTASASFESPGTPVPGAPAVSPALKAFQPGVHWAFFILMVAASGLEFVRFFNLSVWLYLAEWAAGWSLFFTAIAARRQSRADAPATLRKVTVGAVLFLAGYYAIALAAGLYLEFHHHPGLEYGNWIQRLAARPPDATPFQLFLNRTFVVCGWLFGLLGMVELAFHQKRRRQI